MSDGFEYLYAVIYPLGTFLYLYAIFALGRIWHFSKKQALLLDSINNHLLKQSGGASRPSEGPAG